MWEPPPISQMAGLQRNAPLPASLMGCCYRFLDLDPLPPPSPPPAEAGASPNSSFVLFTETLLQLTRRCGFYVSFLSDNPLGKMISCGLQRLRGIGFESQRGFEPLPHVTLDKSLSLSFLIFGAQGCCEDYMSYCT